jgi:predicted dehydrogenase
MEAIGVEPVRTAVVGLGRMGMDAHCSVLDRLEQFELVAGCDATEARRAAAEDAYGLKAYDSIERMLADEDIEFVTVATPSSMHHDHVMTVLAAGKHCLTEKPPAMSTAEWDDMGEAACKAGVTLCCYQNARWNPHQRTAVAAVEQGLLGELQSIKLVYVGYSTVMRTYGVDEYRPQWRAEHRFGGGILYDFGPHHFDRILQVVDHAKAVDIYCELSSRTWSEEVDDGFLAVIRFDNGVVAHVEHDAATRAELSTYIVAGSDGGIQDGILRTGEPGDFTEQQMGVPEGSADEYHLQLYEHFRDGAPPPVPWEHTRQVMVLIDAAFESARSGEVVTIG